MPNKEATKKSHWYLLGYMVPAPGQWVPQSFIGSTSSKILTAPAIQALREAQGLPEQAVLMQFSYVGYATKQTISGTKPAPLTSNISEAYRQGMTAALTAPDEMRLVNPYKQHEEDSQEMFTNATEWDAGFTEGETIKRNAKILQNPSQSVVT